MRRAPQDSSARRAVDDVDRGDAGARISFVIFVRRELSKDDNTNRIDFLGDEGGI